MRVKEKAFIKGYEKKSKTLSQENLIVEDFKVF
jgi:hypothetical protein